MKKGTVLKRGLFLFRMKMDFNYFFKSIIVNGVKGYQDAADIGEKQIIEDVILF